MASESPSAETLRAKLAGEVDLAPWSEMRSHALADRLFLVAGSLDLVEVGVAIALDAATEVAAWIEDRALMRPGSEGLAALDEAPQCELRCLIVQPFVLAQHVEENG